MGFDYEEMRRIYRLEKATSRLVDVPDDFLYQVNNLIDVERKNYLDSLADLNTNKARDFSNLKKLVEELFSIREKKLLNAVLVSTRLQEADDAHMAKEEKELFHLLFNSLSAHRTLTQKALDANGDFSSSKTISIPPKIHVEKKEELRQDASLLSEHSDAQKNIDRVRETYKQEEMPRARVAVAAAGGESISSSAHTESGSPTSTPLAAPAQAVVQRIRILSEIPSFVGTDMKEYGPYKPEQVVELPQKIAQLFISRKLGEANS